MDESTTTGMELNDSGAASRETSILPSAVISVEGYDTSIQQYSLELALTKLFSSCGEITRFYFPRENKGERVVRDFERGPLKSVSYMWITGEDCLNKALNLSGTDMGGWIVTVRATPSKKRKLTLYIPTEFARIRVTGVDTSLPKIDLQMALCKHFYSCGDVKQVLIFPSYAYVDFLRVDPSLKNALKLSGSIMEGMNLVVEAVPARPMINRKRKGPKLHNPPLTVTGYVSQCTLLKVKKEKIEMEMEMEMDEKKKNMMKMELMKIHKEIRGHEKEMSNKDTVMNV